MKDELIRTIAFHKYAQEAAQKCPSISGITKSDTAGEPLLQPHIHWKNVLNLRLDKGLASSIKSGQEPDYGSETIR